MSETSAKRARGVGELKTQAPSYDSDTKLFSQAMTFRAYSTIPAHGAAQVADMAAKQLIVSLGMNGLDDYAWPPDQLDCHAHADGKGMEITVATRAAKRKPVTIQ